jgi:transposase-like protein
MMGITSSNHQHTALPVRQFDLSIPLKRFNGQVSPDTEDTDVTEFVQAHLAKVFSLSEAPPACGHCGNRDTRLRRAARPGQVRMPAFLCLTCKRQFNRLTGTPLANMSKREPASTLMAFAAMLSQQMPYAAAAEKLGLHVMVVSRWTRRMRAWLLQLDPTGHWEAKVRLGVRPPDSVAKCPSCGHTGPVTFLGFVPAERVHGERMRQCRCGVCCGVFRFLLEGPVEAPARDVRDYAMVGHGEPHLGRRIAKSDPA